MDVKSPEEIKELVYQNLATSRYFKNVPAEDLHDFLAPTEYKVFEDKEIVLQQGEYNHNIFVLIGGVASVKIDGQVIHDLQRTGDIFGEMSSFTGQISNLTVEAKEQLEVISVSFELVKSIQDDCTHKLHQLFYNWTSSILQEKLFLTSQKAKLHEDAQENLKDLLDNTGQGIFTFGRDYKVHSQYSKACEYFFEGPIEDKDAMELMFSPPPEPEFSFTEEPEEPEEEEERPDPEAVRELIEMVFTGTAGFSLLGDLLPRELRLVDLFDQVQILALKYHLLEKEDDQRVMITLTDVTKERELAAQMASEEEHHGMIVKIALDKDGFIQSLREMESIFLAIYTLGTRSATEIDANELFRYYHTIKGGAASYGLREIAEAVQKIESKLEGIRSGDDKLTEERFIEYLKDTINLQKTFANILDSLSNIIPKDEIHQEERVFRIKESKISELRGIIEDSFPSSDHAPLNYALDNLIKQPIGPMLKKYAMAAQGVADRLGKAIQVNTRGKDVEISYDHLDEFFGVLVHLVRNCVDHGIEDIETRTMMGKPNYGNINIEGVTENRALKIIIADDGGGIDPEVIKSIALKKGIIDETQSQNFSDEELRLLIFAPGFSTKEEVTSVSGRGVGMDAVKVVVESLNGKIEVASTLDKGTTFTITIPDVA